MSWGESLVKVEVEVGGERSDKEKGCTCGRLSSTSGKTKERKRGRGYRRGLSNNWEKGI